MPVSRRDFLSGMALSGAAFGLSPFEAMARGLVPSDNVWTYPPSKIGMRGNHVGSFEVAHAVALDARAYTRPQDQTDRDYDLVIVGGGISGLSAAHFARKRLGRGASILILDNHDDFGGHAKRNEFTVDGKTLIGYGGSQSIDRPSGYSKASSTLLRDIGVDTDKFYRYYDRSYFSRNGLGSGLYLARGKGLYRNSRKGLWTYETPEEKARLAGLIAALPLLDADKAVLVQLFLDRTDWLVGKSRAEKIKLLRTRSYLDCLRTYLGASEAVCALLRDENKGLWGLGWDALSGLEAVRLWHPGTLGLGLDPAEVPKPYSDPAGGDEPYIFHFPDGNAGIARLLVAELIPDATDGRDMDSIVRAQIHYDRLDRSRNSVRIRLNATVVSAVNRAGGVDVTYVRDGRAERVRARKAVMACYNHMLPHIMPDMPSPQKDALLSLEKVPLAYTNVAVRNWRAWARAGVQEIYAPNAGLIYKASLDFPVSMGGYLYARNPDEPTVLHLVHVPTVPGRHPLEQHRLGRQQMLGLSFDDYERDIRAFLEGALGAHGFDWVRDVAAITVNRWPHGYAYDYSELYHPYEYGRDAGPHVAGRQTVGSIAIANSDAAGYAYVDGAIDAAHLAIRDLYGG